MKSWMGMLAVLALAGLPALASQSEKRAEGPRIEIDPEEHDFGTVRQNQKLVHAFEIRNVGSEDLVIGRIAAACGCTAAIVSDEVVAPGASTRLEVTLETRGYKGAIERSISVSSNDRRVQTVRVKAYVEESLP